MNLNINQFWLEKAWEKSDKHLVQLAKLPFQRSVPFIPKNPGMYFIRGPRQVGKTSWLKTILSHFCQKEKPSSAFYFSCETLRDYTDLWELLQSLGTRHLILLDEISFVENWDRAIKKFIDSGFAGILVITGSNASDIRHGADRMPGRFGAGGEFSLLPMDFPEYRAVRRTCGWKELELHREIECFLGTGGFPSAVIEGGEDAQLPVQSMQEIQRWLLGDVLRLGKQEQYLRELLLTVALSTCTPVSLQSLAQKTQMGSHHTAQDYIQVLEDCFAVRTLYAIDQSGSQFYFRKQKKFYLSDPIFYHLAYEWSGHQTPDTLHAQIAESIVAEYLLRRHKRMGYFTSKGGEIDFVIPPEKAIEVKWSEVPSNLSKAYKEFQVANKEVWYKGRFMEFLE